MQTTTNNSQKIPKSSSLALTSSLRIWLAFLLRCASACALAGSIRTEPRMAPKSLEVKTLRCLFWGGKTTLLLFLMDVHRGAWGSQISTNWVMSPLFRILRSLVTGERRKKNKSHVIALGNAIVHTKRLTFVLTRLKLTTSDWSNLRK